MVCSSFTPVKTGTKFTWHLSKEATMRLPLEHFQTLSEGRLDFKQDPRPDKGDKALDPFRNEKLGGSKNSFHCTTIAVMTLIYKVSISLFVAYHDIAWGHSPKMASWNPGVGIRRCWNPKMLESEDVGIRRCWGVPGTCSFGIPFWCSRCCTC